MATITGLTAERMQEIEAASVIDAEIVGGNLILIKHDGTQINAGPVIGPPGPQGPVGPASVGAVPGEVKLWPGETLPDLASYGKWVWADGAVYPVASHPKAAAHIATRWRTFDGASDPGASNFRVPDMRGMAPAGMDAMPGGTRANRMTRAVANMIASRTGKETHALAVGEMPSHAHGGATTGGTSGAADRSLNSSTSADGNHQHSASSGLGMAVTNQTRNLRTDGSSAYSVITAAELTNFAGHHSHGVYGVDHLHGIPPLGIYAEGSNLAHENIQPTVMVPYIVYLDVV